MADSDEVNAEEQVNTGWLGEDNNSRAAPTISIVTATDRSDYNRDGRGQPLRTSKICICC